MADVDAIEPIAKDPDPAAARWLDPDIGLMAAIAREITSRRLDPSRTIVLLPFGQLIQVARSMWAARGIAGFSPRFETTRSWARNAGGFVAGVDDVAFDRARDLLTAQSLLARAGLASSHSGLAGRLVDTALQLAPLAAAQPPTARTVWAQRLRGVVEAGRGSEWFDRESALNATALAWVGSSAYASDVLFDSDVLAQVDRLIVLEGLQSDPLVNSIASLLDGRTLRLSLLPTAPSTCAIGLHAAAGPEDEAERSAACVLRHLAEGRTPVALVATDRALTRRISAQLVGREVSLRDETGWKLSTTRAAASLMSALRACAHDASSDQVLDWLKESPSVDVGAVRALEFRLREKGVRDWRAWCAYIARVHDPKLESLAAFTSSIETLRGAFIRVRPWSEWLQAVRALLEADGQWAKLAADAAGAEIIAALYLDAEEGEIAASTRATFVEFGNWIRDVLEAASFLPASGSTDEPQVVVLPMQQLLARSFGAVVVAGCDDQKLPASPEPAGDWSVAQRAALGLPSREDMETAHRAAWNLVRAAPHCDLLWRRSDASGEPARPSPLIQWLQAHGSAAAAGDPRAGELIATRPTNRPLPRGDALPLAALSPSAYDDLRRCPYRFFALRQLGLRERDELDTEIDKRDFGNWLHEVLRLFHEALKADPTPSLVERLTLIESANAQATREAGLGDAEFLPFAAAWPAVRDGYLAWLAKHEEGQGATFVEAEPSMERHLEGVKLIGRLDRIDATQDGHGFVIDYKTESSTKTRARVTDPAEDTQLAFYAALLDDDAPRAAYVNVGEKSSGTHTVEQSRIVDARDMLLAGIADDFARIAAGAPLPALGEGTVCKHCAARGLCRRDFWDAPDAGTTSDASPLAGIGARDDAPVGADSPADAPQAEQPVARALAFDASEPAYEHNGAHVSRERFYAIACDPRRSVAVEACAGAGKTWMLVSRVLRALLQTGDEACAPHEILAITFTRKAAGEMRARLDEWLEGFSRQSVEALVPELVTRGMDLAAARAAAPRLQGLHRELLERGRPVQFRTFHAWFASLLRTAPVAVLDRLGLPASYQLLEDDDEARARVWRPFFVAVTKDEEASADYHALVATHGRSQTAKALGEALTRRVEFALADARGAVDDAVNPVGVMFPAFAGAESPDDVLLDHPAFRSALYEAARVLGRADAPGVASKGSELERALTERDPAGVLYSLFTKGKEVAPRKFTAALPGLELIRIAQDHVQQWLDASLQHAARLYQQRMARLTRLLIRCFTQIKAEHGWVDMSDVEQAAHLLLGNAELWGWVQERLDARVRHLLIDEFQDTNPLQWQALHGWLSGYAGAGGRRPGVFIVGDPKQSIYRFRRAEPQVFMAAKEFVQSGLEGDLLNCDHTRRNARSIVGLVNVAMQDAQRAGEFSGFRDHTTESEHVGSLGKLPPIERDAASAAGDEHASGRVWRDSLTMPRFVAEEDLLQKECSQVARWISEQIAGGTVPGKIMVLARRRSRLAALQEELRKLQIAVQQPEKNRLDDAPEVQDLIALLDALVSPDHDLSLARALKSPLWGLDDDALVELSLRQRARRASWFELLQSADLPAPLVGIGSQLMRWQHWLAALPPHDALSAIYHDADVPARFAAAVPAPMRDGVLANVRGLLAASLELDGARYATPYALVRALRAGRARAPALASSDAVQLLTVHGAKGLEADLVVLLDTDPRPTRAETMGALVKWPGRSAAPERFVFLASEKRPSFCVVDDLAEEVAARQREEINGLYVAVTRAKARLVLSATRGPRANAQSWWTRLEAFCEPITVATDPAVADAVDPQTGPFMLMRLPPPVQAPERVGAAALDGRRGPARDDRASALGQAMHRLLEWARGDAPMSPMHVRAAAREFAIDMHAARAAAAMASRIRSGSGAWAWDAEQLEWQGNEVTLLHEGQTLRIDRLVRRKEGRAWWVLDYKSAARPERDEALLAQMNLYCRAVEAAWPGDTVRAAFLTAQGELIELAP